MQRVKGLPRWVKITVPALALVGGLMGVWMWMALGTVEEAAAGEESVLPPVRVVQDDEHIPEAYLFQHFLEELHDCYRQIGQSISLPALERQVGKAWGEAAVALVGYYDAGNCAEQDRFLRIPGRVSWMIVQVQEVVPQETGEVEG